MAGEQAQALATAATVLAEATAKLNEAKKELSSVQKRIEKREGAVAVAQKAYDAAYAQATSGQQPKK